MNDREKPNPKQRRTQARATQPARPLLLEELVTRLAPRDPVKSAGDVPLQLSMMLAAEEPPRIDLSVDAIEEQVERRNFEIKLSIRGSKLGMHALPPKVRAREVQPEKDIRARQRDFPQFEGYLPDHLPLRPLPRQVPQELAVPRRIGTDVLPDRPRDVHEATTVFAPDDRYIFFDTSFIRARDDFP